MSLITSNFGTIFGWEEDNGLSFASVYGEVLDVTPFAESINLRL